MIVRALGFCFLSLTASPKKDESLAQYKKLATNQIGAEWYALVSGYARSVSQSTSMYAAR